MPKSYAPKILLTTGAGNTIKGGADIWTKNKIDERHYYSHENPIYKIYR